MKQDLDKKSKERIIYYYKIPRKRRVGGVYYTSVRGILALTLCFSSFYLSFTDLRYIFLVIIGFFLSLKFLSTLYFYIKYENLYSCIAIDEKGLGYGTDKPEWWLFLDGLKSIELNDGWWELRFYHYDFSFPDGLLSEDDMQHLFLKVEENKNIKL